MKKFILLILICAFAFTLSSCSENMETLLSYQKSEMTARVKISDGQREFLADISQNGEEKRIVFHSPKEYENVEIIFCDGIKIIKYGEMEINCSLSMIFANLRSELESEVYELLFAES